MSATDTWLGWHVKLGLLLVGCWLLEARGQFPSEPTDYQTVNFQPNLTVRYKRNDGLCDEQAVKSVARFQAKLT
jgi:hypothetical protein